MKSRSWILNYRLFKIEENKGINPKASFGLEFRCKQRGINPNDPTPSPLPLKGRGRGRGHKRLNQ